METTRSGNGTDGDLAAVLSNVARTLQAEPDVETTLRSVTRSAVDHLGGDAAGVSLLEDTRITTVAPTDEIVVTVDKLQHHFGE